MLSREERRFLRYHGFRKGKTILEEIIDRGLGIGEVPYGMSEDFNLKLNEKIEELEAEDRKRFAFLWTMRLKYDEETISNWLQKGRQLELLTLYFMRILSELDNRGEWKFIDNGRNIGKGADLIGFRGSKDIMVECKNFTQSKITSSIAGEVENRFEGSISRLGLRKSNKVAVLRGDLTNPAYKILKDYDVKPVLLGKEITKESLETLIMVLALTMEVLFTDDSLYFMDYEKSEEFMAPSLEGLGMWTKTRLREIKAWKDDVFEIGRNIFNRVRETAGDILYFLRSGGCGRLKGNAEVIFYLITDRKFADIFLSTIKVS
jgi:hypothetical protein